jgi:hypothetical protein
MRALRHGRGGVGRLAAHPLPKADLAIKPTTPSVAGELAQMRLGIGQSHGGRAVLRRSCT